MFFLLKLLDRSAWDKKLSFLGKLGLALPTNFERFVIDTRYTLNLLILTLVVGLVGVGVYLGLSSVLRIQEMVVLKRFLSKISGKEIFRPKMPEKKEESITTEPSGSTGL